MIARIFFFLIGFGLTIIGFTYIIGYLNILTLGYTFIEYLEYICTKPECLITLIGFAIITITIFIGGNKNDICI